MVTMMIATIDSPSEMYPIINPALANPRPPSIGFSVILRCAMCPQIIPGTKPNGMQIKLPIEQTSETIAKPEVCCWPGAGGKAGERGKGGGEPAVKGGDGGA